MFNAEIEINAAHIVEAANRFPDATDAELVVVANRIAPLESTVALNTYRTEKNFNG